MHTTYSAGNLPATTANIAAMFEFSVTPALATPAQTVAEAPAALPAIFPTQPSPLAAPAPAWKMTKESYASVKAAINEGLPAEMTAQLDPHGFPDTKTRKNKEGEIIGVSLMSTVENLQHMLGEYGATVRYNEMSKTEEITLPGRFFSRDNEANAAIAEVTSICRRNSMPVTDLLGYITLLGERNRYHPVCEWVLSKPWDGASRLQALYDTLAVEERHEAHRDAVVRRWLISAICAAFSTNALHAFHGVLVLQGTQEAGKTSWALALVKEAVQSAIAGGQAISPSNKDSVLDACKHWICELGELNAITSKVDINEIKNFVTKTSDSMRQAFAKKHSDFKRRTVFIATVNDSKFLVDTTGNRRWWTVPVLGITYQHTIDMQQLWAEVHELWAAGEQWHLTKDESAELNRINCAHEVDRPMEELLNTYFDFEGQHEKCFDGQMKPCCPAVGMNPTLISKVLKLGFEGNTVRMRDLAAALRKLTGQVDAKSVRTKDGKIVKGWLLVPKSMGMFEVK